MFFCNSQKCFIRYKIIQPYFKIATINQTPVHKYINYKSNGILLIKHSSDYSRPAFGRQSVDCHQTAARRPTICRQSTDSRQKKLLFLGCRQSTDSRWLSADCRSIRWSTVDRLTQLMYRPTIGQWEPKYTWSKFSILDGKPLKNLSWIHIRRINAPVCPQKILEGDWS